MQLAEKGVPVPGDPVSLCPVTCSGHSPWMFQKSCREELFGVEENGLVWHCC